MRAPAQNAGGAGRLRGRSRRGVLRAARGGAIQGAMKIRAMLSLVSILAGVLAAGCQESPKPASGSPPEASAQAAELKEGDAAPDVEIKLQNGNSMKLSQLRGKPVAIFFYPKDETPGCTVEAQGIRDSWADLSAASVAVIGVSTQDAESHKSFIEKEKLPFDLAVDTDGSLAKAFGVPLKNGYAARQTFLIGADGKLKKIWRQVTPTGHAAEILTAARS